MIGYFGDGEACDNINECVIHGTEPEVRHNCASYAECLDLEGKFECFCKEGYSGDGVYCTGGLHIQMFQFTIVYN